jgi:chromosome segregation ATPase
MSTTETKPQTSEGEGVNTDGTGTGAGTPTGTPEAPKPKTFTQAELDDIIKGRLADQKKAIERAAEEQRAQEQGEWKTLAESRAVELQTATADRDTLKGRVEALESRLHAIADERVKALPEKLRARVPEADKAGADARLEKIEELEAVLAEVPTQPVPPGLGRAPKPAGGANPKQQVDEAVERALRSGGYGF